MSTAATGLMVSRRSALCCLACGITGLQAAEAPATGPTPSKRIVWPVLQWVDAPAWAAAGTASGFDRPTIVVFWEPWCPYCKRHNARIEQLYQSPLAQNIRILGASTDPSQDKLRAYMQTHQFHFPVAMVTAAFRAQFSDRRVVPLTCLVAPDGTLVQAIAGEMALQDVMSLAAQTKA